MMPDLPQSFATVTSSAYLPGTRVMLDSFLHHNPWFKGVVIVIHPDLTPAEQNELKADFEQIEFRQPSPELSNAIEQLARAEPKLQSRAARFLSLECFWLESGDDMLFCDGDVLFSTDISDVFAKSGDILACPDRSQSLGNARDAKTMAEIERVDGGHASFNAGLMYLRPSMRTVENRARICDLLSPESWRGIQSDHTDQAVLNMLFGSDVTLLPERYNFLIGHAAALRGVVSNGLADAAVLHFNGPAKPWRIEHHRSAASDDAVFIRAYEQWFAAHIRYLKRHHFASRR